MGLDTSHGAWHGAYSAFMRWRCKVAELAGMPPLRLMEGFFEKGAYTDPFVEWGKRLPGLADDYYAALPIKWESLKPDPLHELLYHSDCDGQIPASSCNAIAARLEELLPLMPKGEAGGHIGDWRDKTQTFIDGLRAAAQANEPLDFH